MVELQVSKINNYREEYVENILFHFLMSAQLLNINSTKY